MWEIIESLKILKSTIILTTHHLDEADYLSDRICVIEKGDLIAEGTPNQIKDQYGKGYYLSIHSEEEENQPPFDPVICNRLVK